MEKKEGSRGQGGLNFGRLTLLHFLGSLGWFLYRTKRSG